MAMSSTLNLSRSIASQIRSKILLSGPITVAEYMKSALTQTTKGALAATTTSSSVSSDDKLEGYYMKKDVFGEKGDFITSPEISQMFGELLGVWAIQCWRQLKGPTLQKLNLVELGPGRGTLANDMLRVFNQFEGVIGGDISLNLVEVSPHLSKLQLQTLCDIGGAGEINDATSIQPTAADTRAFQQGLVKKSKYPVAWYKDLRDVPEEFSVYVAHEFFDALPIHKFQKGENGWREVLVDIGSNEDDFRFVIARNETPVLKVLQTRFPSIFDTSRKHLEISLDAITILDELTTRLDTHGGIALIVDYGHEGTKEDTFRAFLKHQLHDPLIAPGTADLTADVDFSVIKQIFSEKGMICGPVTQETFLRRVGIDVRLENLLKAVEDEKLRNQLQSGYKMMMEDMGSRFHFLGIFPKVLEQFLPNLKIAGFHH